MKSIIFNPEYHLRQDGNRVILFSDENVSNMSEDWFSFIHPLHAMMFSFFNGKNTAENEIEQCARFFNLPLQKMDEIISYFLEKPHWNSIKSGNDWIRFPKNVLLYIEVGIITRKEHYIPTDFKYLGPPDYNTVRLNYPISLNMELTMKCYANCIYCYANRNLRDKYMLSLKEIQSVIKEAKTNGVYNIDINGGDVLLHPHIKEILRELAENGYSPLISTKMVPSKDVIDYILSLKPHVRLQISLDSSHPEILHKLIGVPLDYISNMSEALEYLTTKEAKIQINVVLTKYNSAIEDIKHLLDYLSSYKTVEAVRFNPCGYSLYKEGFKELVVSAEQMDYILSEIERLKNKYPNIDIKASPFDRKCDFLNKSNNNMFSNRALCTGGTRSAVLLPNGDVTICEELYEHPSFILGNVRENSLEEIWNSPKVKNLYQSPFKNDSSSVCKACTSQRECRTGIGICWEMAVMAYGMNQWDYPDPRCPKAPNPKFDFYYE